MPPPDDEIPELEVAVNNYVEEAQSVVHWGLENLHPDARADRAASVIQP